MLQVHPDLRPGSFTWIALASSFSQASVSVQASATASFRFIKKVRRFFAVTREPALRNCFELPKVPDPHETTNDFGIGLKLKSFKCPGTHLGLERPV